MSKHESVEREIAAPAERLWEMVSDVTRMGEWSPETTGASWVGGADGPAPGARFKGRNRSGWQRWSTVCTVTDCEPGRVFAFDVNGGPIPVSRWEYRFEPTDGGCRVTETWTDRRSPMAARIFGLLTGVRDRASHNRAGMEKTLEQLAAAAERTGTTGTTGTAPS